MLNLELVDVFSPGTLTDDVFMVRSAVGALLTSTLEDGGEDPRRRFDIGSRWRHATSQDRYAWIIDPSGEWTLFLQVCSQFRTDYSLRAGRRKR